MLISYVAIVYQSQLFIYSVSASVHIVVSNLQISDRRMQDIKRETTQDTQLRMDKWTILMANLLTRKQCNALIIQGENIVIPKVL